MAKLLKWLDNNIIKVLVIAFVFIVPLYPKIPFKMVNYTYVAIRLEDIFFAFMALVFVIQFLRKKVTISSKFLKLFAVFWFCVLLSTLCGIYIQKTIILPHLGWLHALRRVEYMSLFFIVLSTIRSKKDFIHIFGALLFSFLLVNIYGFGQKFLGWPAVQTMNPEYAKGYLLYLTPEARVSSTFAGHYDLAAYIIFLIPVLLAYFMIYGNVLFFGLFLLSLTILVFTASRASYIAYIISTGVFLVWARKWKTLIAVVIATVCLTLLSNNLTLRIKRTFQVKKVFVNEQTGQVIIPQSITPDDLPAGNFFVPVTDQTGAGNISVVDQQIVNSQVMEQIREKARKEGKVLTPDEEAVLFASLSAMLKPINTIASDISFATRLQVEWPRAIKAFRKNPLLGTGPSSITEATDNDFLRWLGEFGLLGTLSFMCIIFSIVKAIWIKFKETKPPTSYLFLGLIFSIFGLLINATYIDVFEASKVAYIFWLTCGLFVGLSQLKGKIVITNEKE